MRKTSASSLDLENLHDSLKSKAAKVIRAAISDEDSKRKEQKQAEEKKKEIETKEIERQEKRLDAIKHNTNPQK